MAQDQAGRAFSVMLTPLPHLATATSQPTAALTSPTFLYSASLFAHFEQFLSIFGEYLYDCVMVSRQWHLTPTLLLLFLWGYLFYLGGLVEGFLFGLVCFGLFCLLVLPFFP